MVTWHYRVVDFESAYSHGFARVAACTVPVSIADPETNATAILSEAPTPGLVDAQLPSYSPYMPYSLQLVVWCGA